MFRKGEPFSPQGPDFNRREGEKMGQPPSPEGGETRIDEIITLMKPHLPTAVNILRGTMEEIANWELKQKDRSQRLPPRGLQSLQTVLVGELLYLTTSLAPTVEATRRCFSVVPGGETDTINRAGKVLDRYLPDYIQQFQYPPLFENIFPDLARLPDGGRKIIELWNKLLSERLIPPESPMGSIGRVLKICWERIEKGDPKEMEYLRRASGIIHSLAYLSPQKALYQLRAHGPIIETHLGHIWPEKPPSNMVLDTFFGPIRALWNFQRAGTVLQRRYPTQMSTLPLYTLPSSYRRPLIGLLEGLLKRYKERRDDHTLILACSLAGYLVEIEMGEEKQE